MKRFALVLSLTLLLVSPALAEECAPPAGTGGGEIVATTEDAPVYTVRPGDTLWDISRRSFDTPWVWPKLWEQNRSVANPHRLSPGQKIKLYLGTYQPPRPAAPEVVPAQALAPELTAPVLFKLNVEDVGYLSPEKAQPVGSIIGSQDPLKIQVGEGDLVFIRLEEAAPAVGQRFRVVHVSEEQVLHPATDQEMGYRHTFPAVLEVVQIKDDLATAKVSEATEEIEVGDGFVPWFEMPQAVALKRGGSRVEGHVIDSQTHSTLMGKGQLVFLDVGREAGLEPGRVLGVWREQRELAAWGEKSDKADLGGLEATRVGEAVVVLVNPETSTALITQSRVDLEGGDIVHEAP